MKILLINSDVAKNRGDRAITEGMVQLVKERFPDAQITGISEHSRRDAEWFDIKFLNMDNQSLNPTDLFYLLREAHRSDFVFWGGGEILKDYTNKAALWYWVGKIWLVSLANKNLYGTYQGTGPTYSKFSKKLIRFVVNRCRMFAVRDYESYEKLVSWGCSPERVLPASDPAVLPSSTSLSDETMIQLRKEFNIDDDFLKNFVSIGPRDWFHYKQGGLIPYKYKKKLGLLYKPTPTNTKKHDKYLSSLVHVCEKVIKDNHNILFIPMHMTEEDIKLCHYLKDRVSEPDKVRLLDNDTLTPSDLRSVMSLARAMVGFRLHSTIIATSNTVPCINYYYVDKGRVYFDQIEQSENAFPIEDLLADNFDQKFDEVFTNLKKNEKIISATIAKNLKKLRHVIRATFNRMIDSNV